MTRQRIHGRMLKASLLMLMAVCFASAGPIDYYINQTIGAGSVSGYIETDGTTGVLSAANILRWNLLLTDGGTTFNLANTTFFSSAGVFGSDLSATATNLLFNFSGADFGDFVFTDATFDNEVGFSAHNDFPAGCLPGAGLSVLIGPGLTIDHQCAPMSGNRAIASMSFLPLQGGLPTAPITLPIGSAVDGVVGTVGGFGTQSWYGFQWPGGAFTTTASINGSLNAGASYLFAETPFVGNSCTGPGASATLNSSDGYTQTLSVPNLASGTYCVGIVANNPNDPNFLIAFNTPVGAVPEPSSFLVLLVGLPLLLRIRNRKRADNFTALHDSH